MGKGLFDLVALDMDGTLLNSRHETTYFTRKALLKASEAGKIISLCTGRCLSELREHLDTIPGIRYAICENGGCLYDVKAGKVIMQSVIDKGKAEHILSLASQRDVLVQCFIRGQSLIQLEDTERLEYYHMGYFSEVFAAGSIFCKDVWDLWRKMGDEMEKINLYFASGAEKEHFRVSLGETELSISDSLGIGFEISPPDAAKGIGLKRLCELVNVSVDRSMAVGDGGNDVDLMRAAGFSVAMGNAEEAVKREANVLTEDCDNDGAAKAVLRYMLGIDDFRLI